MDIIIRLEEEKDYRKVEEITRAAFHYSVSGIHGHEIERRVSEKYAGKQIF